LSAYAYQQRVSLLPAYARWGRFDLRREMAMVIERSLRETLAETADDQPGEIKLVA
jgi:hypothetical protein